MRTPSHNRSRVPGDLSRLDPHVARIAAGIIRAATPKRPADRLLRETLKMHRDLSEENASAVARTVFDYFRWLGWLNIESGINRKLERALELDEQFDTSPGSFAAESLRGKAVPPWVLEEMDAPDAWFTSLQRRPRLWLRARKGQGTALAKSLRHCRIFGEGKLADTLEYLGLIDLFRTSEFHKGQFELQDLSSQAVGWICDPQPGETWWDACAGEGGKLLHLSELMGNKGLIWASDRAEWRLKQLKRRAARAGVFNYRSVFWNGGASLPTRTRFDGVLVDAPCSGLGTWQRNPHARWTTRKEDVHELSSIQANLLAHAARSVKPGGRLIYSVCTLTRAETEQVAERFEAAAPSFQPVPTANPLKPTATPASRIWLWPQGFGANGMFIAVWRNNG